MAKNAYQLKVTLVGTKPPIWRRVVVDENTSLARLHRVLQAAFGWWDCHLHEFEVDGVRYGIDDGEGWGEPPKDERRAKLRDLAQQGSAFMYVYDFGDNWEHKIVVEEVLARERGVALPACTGGRRACPPEDCGGIWGYEEFLAAVTDPSHPEHDAMLDWVGGKFDPEAFEPAEFDHRLAPGRGTAP